MTDADDRLESTALSAGTLSSRLKTFQHQHHGTINTGASSSYGHFNFQLHEESVELLKPVA